MKPFFVWRTGSGGRRGSSRSRPHPASPKQHPETKDNLNNGHENTLGTLSSTFKERYPLKQFNSKLCGDLNNKLVWYSIGPNLLDRGMVS